MNTLAMLQYKSFNGHSRIRQTGASACKYIINVTTPGASALGDVIRAPDESNE